MLLQWNERDNTLLSTQPNTLQQEETKVKKGDETFRKVVVYGVIPIGTLLS